MVAMRAMEVFSLFRVRKKSVARKHANELPIRGFSKEISPYGGSTF